MGANRKSYGLDVNVLIMCLICFGVKEGEQAAPHTSAAAGIVNDLPSKRPAAKKKSAAKPDPVMEILTALFGQNKTKVHAILTTSNAYAALFTTHAEKWEQDTTEYKQDRALQAYWGGDCLLYSCMVRRVTAR